MSPPTPCLYYKDKFRNKIYKKVGENIFVYSRIEKGSYWMLVTRRKDFFLNEERFEKIENAEIALMSFS